MDGEQFNIKVIVEDTKDRYWLILDTGAKISQLGGAGSQDKGEDALFFRALYT